MRDETTGIVATVPLRAPEDVRELVRLPNTTETRDANDVARASARPCMSAVVVAEPNPRPSQCGEVCGGCKGINASK
jgi:hypothetical protein